MGSPLYWDKRPETNVSIKRGILYIFIYSSAHTLARSLYDVARAKKHRFAVVVCSRLAFHASECDFFLEIFESKNFSFEEGIIVQGLKPIRKVKAGLAPGIYPPNSEFIRQFFSLCLRVREENNNRQFIGGKNINERAIRDISFRREEMALPNQNYKFVLKHHRKIILATLVISSPVIHRIANTSIKYISEVLWAPIRK